MVNFNFVIVLVLILVVIKLFVTNEYFSNCSQYGNNYTSCYDSGHCTIMLDMTGNAFCTDK